MAHLFLGKSLWMPEERERRINVRVSEEFYRELDKKRFVEETSWQEICAGLLKHWLSGEVEPQRDEDPAHAQLRVILASKDTEAIRLTRQFLGVIGSKLRPARKH